MSKITHFQTCLHCYTLRENGKIYAFEVAKISVTVCVAPSNETVRKQQTFSPTTNCLQYKVSYSHRTTNYLQNRIKLFTKNNNCLQKTTKPFT